MARARVIAPDGTVGSVPESQLKAALASGYRKAEEPATSETPVVDTLRAGAEGVLRGLTFGLSDEFIAGAEGAPYRDENGVLVVQPVDTSADIGKRRDESPVASFLGQAAGTVLNPATRALSGAQTLRGAVALGTVEGGLYGLGNAITEDAIGDKEALGEKLLANVGLGAVLGAPAGAIGFGLTRGANALSKKLANSTLKADLDGLKDVARNVRGGAYKEAAEKAGYRWEAVDDFARAEGIFTARATPESVVETAAEASRRARAEAAKALDAFGGPDGYFDTEEIARAVGEEGKRIFRSYLPDEQKLGRGVINYAESMLDDHRSFPSWQRWLDVVVDMRGQQAPYKRKAADEVFKAGLKMIAREDEELAKVVADNVMKARMADFLAVKARGAGAPSLSDAMTAGVMGGIFGGPGGAVTAAAGSLLSGELRRRAPFLTAAALEAAGPGLKRAAEGLAQHVGKVLSTVPELLGPFRSVLMQAASEGAPELLRAHVELASSEAGPDYLARLGLEAEDEQMTQAAIARAAVLDTIEAQAGSVDERLDTWAKRMAGKASGPAPALPAPTRRDMGEQVSLLREVVKDPESFLSRTPAEMMNDAPGVTIAMAQQAVKAAQYLLNAAPKNPWEHLPENMRPKWTPNPADVAAYEAAAMGVEDPLGALERMVDGRTKPQTLEAIAQVYPRLYEEAREKLFERVSTAKNLTYRQRLALQPILGPVATGSTFEQQNYMMQMYAKQRQPQAAPRGGPDGRQVVSTTQNLQTQATRMEARGMS